VSSILLIVCIFVFPQKLAEPSLVGVWRLGYEDYGEFIYHKVDQFGSYLKDNPNAKMVARLCSSDDMSRALAGSHGFAYTAPVNRMFFARWSKCESKTEEYWFVPENGRLEYDEMIPAEKVRVNRALGSSQDEFAQNLKEFITELKNNPQTEGFIIRNIGMSDRKLKEALRQLRNEKVDGKRFQILSKRSYRSYYPEFMTVTISE
jgi:hypothetical protein